MRRDQGYENLAFFLVGGLAGAAIGVLLAPRSGRDLRDGVSEGLRSLQGRVREAGDRAWATASRALEDVQEERDAMADEERGEVLYSNRPADAPVQPPTRTLGEG